MKHRNTRKAPPRGASLGKERNPMWIIILALIVCAALILGGIIIWTKKSAENAAIDWSAQPVDESISINDEGTISLAVNKDAPKITIWEDYMCPSCASFENNFAEDIKQNVLEGKLAVDYQIVDFMNRNSISGEYSTRTLAATQCVAMHEPIETVFNVKNIFFSEGAQGGDDLSSSQLADLAKKAGADPSLDCIRGIERTDSMDRAKDTAENSLQNLTEANKEGASTPTVSHDGEIVDISDVEWLNKVIAG